MVNFPPLEYELDLVTQFQRIGYGKEQIIRVVIVEKP